MEHEKAEKIREIEEQKRREAEQKEKDRLARLAEKQMKNDKFEKAEETIEKIEEVFIAPVVVAEPERQIKNESGKVDMTSRKDIKISVVNVKKLLQSVLDGKMPIKAIKILEGEVKKHIKAFEIEKAQAFKYGVVVEDIFTTIVR